MSTGERSVMAVRRCSGWLLAAGSACSSLSQPCTRKYMQQGATAAGRAEAAEADFQHGSGQRRAALFLSSWASCRR